MTDPINTHAQRTIGATEDGIDYRDLRHGKLPDLVRRLQEENLLKLDFVVGGGSIRMRHDASLALLDAPIGTEDGLDDLLRGSGVHVAGGTADLDLDILDRGHRSIGSRLGIPRKYYKRMLDGENDLLAQNVNRWLDRSEKPMFARTFRPAPGSGGRGVFRALLSNAFRPLDNYDFLLAALDTIKDMGLQVQIGSCNLTESRMYVVINAPGIHVDGTPILRGYRNPQTGDGGENAPSEMNRIYAGLVLSNSEVGTGALQVLPRPFSRRCMNAFTFKKDALRKHHLGARLEEGVINWSDETKEKNMEVVASQIKDAVRAFFTTDYLDKVVARSKEAAETEVKKPQRAIEAVSKTIGLTEAEQDDVLGYFMRQNDTTAMGVLQATTFHAQQVGSADRQFEIEQEAGSILDAALRSVRQVEKEERAALLAD